MITVVTTCPHNMTDGVGLPSPPCYPRQYKGKYSEMIEDTLSWNTKWQLDKQCCTMTRLTMMLLTSDSGFWCDPSKLDGWYGTILIVNQ